MFAPVGLASRPSGRRGSSLCSWCSGARRLERLAQPGFDQSEDQQRDPDDADERVDAVVVMQEDRADLECLFEIAVAAFDDFLVFVEA